ncbi:hypothetical protein TorRG33x02_260940 [Trema orientale]|uniref:Uncharacterized protein n=1 Tax=Trema orientale TaxID=63057 RepID=A0A2P5D682_TREOI|nr:hypothetical protein TorRG33x02_260940 [Trema orientale]
MQMKRVALGAKNASVLHDQLHTSIVRQHHHLCPTANAAHISIVRSDPGEVEWPERKAREVGRVNPICSPKEMGLEQSSGRQSERHVVHRCREFSPVCRPLTCLVSRAWIGS